MLRITEIKGGTVVVELEHDDFIIAEKDIKKTGKVGDKIKDKVCEALGRTFVISEIEDGKFGEEWANYRG